MAMTAQLQSPPLIVVHETVTRLAARVIAQDKRIETLSRRIDALNAAIAERLRDPRRGGRGGT